MHNAALVRKPVHNCEETPKTRHALQIVFA
jgi:hypothetical protein